MGFVGKEKGKKGKAKVTTKQVNESYDHDAYEGEYVDELYDEVTGINEEDPDGDWDPWGRRVVRTKSAEAAAKNAASGGGGGVDSDSLLAQLFQLRDDVSHSRFLCSFSILTKTRSHSSDCSRSRSRSFESCRRFRFTSEFKIFSLHQLSRAHRDRPFL
jgi:hypothetical protein